MGVASASTRQRLSFTAVESTRTIIQSERLRTGVGGEAHSQALDHGLAQRVDGGPVLLDGVQHQRCAREPGVVDVVEVSSADGDVCARRVDKGFAFEAVLPDRQRRDARDVPREVRVDEELAERAAGAELRRRLAQQVHARGEGRRAGDGLERRDAEQPAHAALVRLRLRRVGGLDVQRALLPVPREELLLRAAGRLKGQWLGWAREGQVR